MRILIFSFCLFLVLFIFLCGCTGTSVKGMENAANKSPEATVPVLEERFMTVPTPDEKNPSEVNESFVELSFAEKVKLMQKQSGNEPPVQMKIGETSYIYLIENPSTGFSWNASVTPGLKIINDSYVAVPGIRPGVGGGHNWTIEGVALGNQTFFAVYKRPWEPPSPDDINFTQLFQIIK